MNYFFTNLGNNGGENIASGTSGHPRRRDNASPNIDVDYYLLPLRGRDNPKQNIYKYFFFHYATYATLPVTRVVTGFVKSVYHATYPATTMPNTYATTR